MNKRIEEKKTCCCCEKKLGGKPFVDKRYCNGKDSHGVYVWGMFCLDCEPYPEMGEHH